MGTCGKNMDTTMEKINKIIIMNKHLVFHFYANEHTINDFITEIHLRCLKHYADIFDNMTFCVSVDDVKNTDLILEIEHKLLEIQTNGNISFKIVKNDEYRESSTFTNEIVKKLDDEDMVFFAHNKGTTNILKYPKEEIYTWVIAMYYYNLEFIGEVTDALYNKKYISYGTFLTQNDEPEHLTKNGWYYNGTYYWINCTKLKEYMYINNIAMPKMSDRFYAEEFLSNIYGSWPLALAASHNSAYLIDCMDYYNHTREYLNWLYPNDEGYNGFYKEITDEISK